MDYRQISDELVFKCEHFEKLSIHTLYELLALRMSVFCVEQNCPYQDADGKDLLAWHVLVYRQGKLVATARLLMPGESYDYACSIGRVACDPRMRGIKVGQQLMAYAVSQCEFLFPSFPIRIGAQKYLKSFYSQFGFKVEGQPYLEDGIVHLEMLKPVVTK